MEKSLLWEAFSALAPAEVREFGKFVRSPFFNTRSQLVEWCDVLTAHYQHKTIPNMDGGAGVKNRLAQSALLALLEQYLVYKETFADEGRGKIKLAAAYRKRNLNRHFRITLKEARQDRERQTWRHAGYYSDLHDIEWEQYQFDTAQRRTEALNIQVTSDDMDMAFLSKKLRLACLAVSHKAVYKTEYDIGLLPSILETAADKTHLPLIGLYYHCYRFLTEKEAVADAHFAHFQEIMQQSLNCFPKEELRTLYLLALNFCIKQLNESKPSWQRPTLQLYKDALVYDLLMENGQISRFAFNNIVAIAIRAGEADWAETFVHEYRPRLERSWRDLTASLNLARVAYARKDYTTALQQLQRSDYKDTINNLSAKTLQLKIFYEMDEFDLLSSHLASLKNYIRRHAVIGYHRENYMNIVRYTTMLMALNPNDNKAKKALYEKIEAEKILTEKEWFLEVLHQ